MNYDLSLKKNNITIHHSNGKKPIDASKTVNEKIPFSNLQNKKRKPKLNLGLEIWVELRILKRYSVEETVQSTAINSIQKPKSYTIQFPHIELIIYLRDTRKIY